ncbi:hypothetical protein DMENIID0001_021670 [Sergentomyia squamirostris]
MTPVFPGSSRLAGQDIILKGYQIPKNTDILMYTYLLNYDEQHFPNPYTFMPERWLRTLKKDSSWGATFGKAKIDRQQTNYCALVPV